ncbi:MAG: peptide chain release factor 2 [Clostridiales bacterium]|nr:peptide chain release factor 2 [Clostridiales bacterium]
MIIIENEIKRLDDAKAQLNLIKECLDLSDLLKQIQELKEIQLQENFYSDIKKAQKVGMELRNKELKLEKIAFAENLIGECETALELLGLEQDEETAQSLVLTIQKLENFLADFKIETLLSGKYDSSNAILTLHAGAGGTEAQDWVNMLYRMYTMYAEKKGFKINVLDSLDGDDAGLKSITFEVVGANAYGYLKCEKGVHRLVRISPFDANARRHTSFASLDVMPVLDETPNIQIRQEDLKVDTYRSSGAGGQHVNKTESAIRITHIPTGIIVACQNERSQIQNREMCMKMLYSKLAQKAEEEELALINDIRGEIKKIEWGSQIRSYVFQPYTMVKDHRTNFENTDIQSVMNGNIQEFINDYLVKSR